MTFRDDHDAALARADALEDEVERTKRERDALAAKVRELEARAVREAKPKPKPKRPPSEPDSSSDPETSSGKGPIIAGIGVAVVLFAAMAIIGSQRSCTYRKEHAIWQAATDARKAHRDRWNALSPLAACVHDIAWGTMSVRESTPDKLDPRTTSRYYPPGRATSACRERAAGLLADPKTTPAVKAALGPWIDLQREIEAAAKPADAYYSNQDWREDNLAAAPELWKPVLAKLERQRRQLEQVRRDVLPAVFEELRALARAHEARSGRDEIYWRVVLTVALSEIVERGFEASGIYAGAPPDLAAAGRALQQPVTQFQELVKAAPIEVRRDLRRLDWILDPFAAGDYSRAETPLWHLQNDEDKLLRGRNTIPAMPPDPGDEPEEPTTGD